MSEQDERRVDLVNITPETQLLIFTLPDCDVEAVIRFQEIISDLLGDNSKVRVILSTAEVKVQNLSSEDLSKLGLFYCSDLVDVMSGQLSALALAVNSDEIPLDRISQALQNGDLEELEGLKQEMLEKAFSGSCPICGTLST